MKWPILSKSAQYVLGALVGIGLFIIFICWILDFARDTAANGDVRSKYDAVIHLSLGVVAMLCGVQMYVSAGKSGKPRWKAFLFFLPGLLLLAAFVTDFSNPPRKKYNSPFASEFAAAATQLEKSPPGIQRVEEFVARLRAMENRGDMPVPLKKALHDYTVTLEEGVISLKTGSYDKSFDAKLTVGKQKVLDNLR